MLTPAQISDDARPRLARGVRLQIDNNTGRAVLLYPEGILELNETAQEILTLCSGPSIADIASELSEYYEADAATIAVEIREIIADLHRRKLIEFA